MHQNEPLLDDSFFSMKVTIFETLNYNVKALEIIKL